MAKKGEYQAFRIDEECIDKKIVKISFNEHDQMVTIGRIAIKNRIRGFQIEVKKFNMNHSTFRVEVSYHEGGKVQIYDM